MNEDPRRPDDEPTQPITGETRAEPTHALAGRPEAVEPTQVIASVPAGVEPTQVIPTGVEPTQVIPAEPTRVLPDPWGPPNPADRVAPAGPTPPPPVAWHRSPQLPSKYPPTHKAPMSASHRPGNCFPPR